MSESKTVPEKKAGPITGWPCPGLRHAKRFITTHDKDGQSVFHTEDDGQHHRVMVKGMAVANIMYNTKEHQVDMNDEKDIAYARENEPGVCASNGTVVRMFDVAPAAISPMHRSASLDYGVVIEGDFELILDSGETRVLHPGDVVINRGVTHMWRNPNPDKWGRILFVLIDTKPLYINGKHMCEELGGMTAEYGVSKH